MRALEPNIALRGVSPLRRAIFKRADGDSVHLLKLFVGRSTLAELAARRKKNLERAKAQSKPRELVRTRPCGPTELFPVLSQIRARPAH